MKKKSRRVPLRFALTIAAITLPLGALFDTSTIALNRMPWYIGLIVVLIIVLIGVFFDMLGLAAAAARETPFHAMASKKIFGARKAIVIVRNAEKVASICSDVIGDIAGVLSGAGALAVSVQLMKEIYAYGWYKEAISIVITALVTALTVGWKAIGKTIAIQSPTPIVLLAARSWETVSFLFEKSGKLKSRKSLRSKMDKKRGQH
ncbi:hypothetical protein ACOJUR_10255 [Alicyclobacillus tolerans]|uniref:CNNM transmembrane domain-containing protein n=2 Tax=Alicyclobacillus tolerans TaxID=90970 RepID=A0A1M6S5P2_9BACL|nr:MULTISPECIES: hypothetical protein [Alicyclobacillus]MDP9728731.1 CBS domain containing-hemolysin-like protein [Alicyclobacillus tengchongensis]QRF23255.1 hypothetical protein FY534_05890 [Alicyclobacillus sp. TC]SHK39979.1 hypothetical protein SAMN05443507_11334 [Alicyclobacillus montanus]